MLLISILQALKDLGERINYSQRIKVKRNLDQYFQLYSVFISFWKVFHHDFQSKVFSQRLLDLKYFTRGRMFRGGTLNNFQSVWIQLYSIFISVWKVFHHDFQSKEDNIQHKKFYTDIFVYTYRVSKFMYIYTHSIYINGILEVYWW